MTNKQALEAVIQFAVSDNLLLKSLTDHEIVDSATYAKENEKNIDLAAIDVLQGLLSTPDVSEGGYSINLDRAAIQKRLSMLAGKHDITDPSAPKVRGIQPW